MTTEISFDDVLTGIKADQGMKVAVHGPPGIGKSTLGAQFPGPLFFDFEGSLTNIDVPHFDLREKKFEETMDALRLLWGDDHKFESLIIDTVDWLEIKIHDHVCEKMGIQNIGDPDYGRGYSRALDHWKEFLDACEFLKSHKGMNIILLAHTKQGQVSDPMYGTYNRHTLKCRDKASELIVEWADMVLYADMKVFLDEKKQGFTKTTTAHGGQRILHTQGKPAFVAKCRFSIPEELHMGYEHLINAIQGGVDEN